MPRAVLFLKGGLCVLGARTDCRFVRHCVSFRFQIVMRAGLGLFLFASLRSPFAARQDASVSQLPSGGKPPSFFQLAEALKPTRYDLLFFSNGNCKANPGPSYFSIRQLQRRVEAWRRRTMASSCHAGRHRHAGRQNKVGVRHC